MTKTKIILVIIVSALLLIGLAVGVTVAVREHTKEVCSGYEVEIEGNEHGMLKVADIDNHLKYKNLNPTGVVCDSVNLALMESELQTLPLVSEVECYILESGKLIIKVKARTPLFHVKTKVSDYCIDSNGHQMNTPAGLSEKTFKVTGDVTLEYAMESIYPIVKYITESKEYANEFSSIEVGRGNQVSMKSKKYGYMVCLGTGERYMQKLEKLEKFRKYDKNKELQGKYKSIDLQFRGQVVCKRLTMKD